MRTVTREARLLAALLLGVLAWEFSGLDLPMAHLLGGDAGFPLRDSAWARGVGHEAVRAAEMLLWLGLTVDALRPGRRDARRTWLVGLVVLLAVPALKSVSRTSCPWDLQIFGGSVPWVSHWNWSLRDGGPGHCFPSGHTAGVAAFAAWCWRARSRGLWALWAAVLTGASLAQWVRGAHFVSHSLWAAWLSLALSWALLRALDTLNETGPLRAAAERA